MILHNTVKAITSFLMILVLLGCNEKQHSPTELSFGLESYSSIRDVESRILQLKGKWNIVENNALNKSDVRPKYEFVRVETDIFSDAGYQGKTLLSFYNGKLMSVWFYADDWDKYKKYLEKKRNIVIKDNMWERVSNNVRVWITVDHERKYYIAWEDIALADSMRKWIEKYS